MKIKKWVITSTSTLFLGSVGTIINSKIQNINIVESLMFILKSLGHLSIKIMNISIPIWGILATIILFIIIIYIYNKFSSSNQIPPKKEKTTLDFRVLG